MSTYIYGKLFASMFEGSLIGAGSHVFAVMAYVISHMRPGLDREEYVRLHPTLLATAIGEKEGDMEKAIAYLCKKDPKTTTPGEDGRRLVCESPYLYRVVNGAYYRGLMNEDDRRTKSALRQQRFRDKQKLKEGLPGPLPGETAAVRQFENGHLDKDFQPISENSHVEQSKERKVMPVFSDSPPMTSPESASAPVGANSVKLDYHEDKPVPEPAVKIARPFDSAPAQ